jgi:hypothetical protein
MGSPLVQLITMPISVIVVVHLPIIMLQQHMHMPFIIMQQEHMPPAIIEQRFCIITAVVLSSQVQVIFMPPVHFSIFMVQRGTIPMDGVCMPLMFGIDIVFIMGIPPIPIIMGIPIMDIRSFIIVVMASFLSSVAV